MFNRLRFYDFVDTGIIAVNNNIVIYFNKNAADYLGLTDKECYTARFAEILPGLDIENETPQKIYTDSCSFLVTPKLIKDTDIEGVTILTISDISNILDTKRKCEILDDKCKGLEMAIDSITDEIFIADSRGFTEYVNSAVERIYGILPEKLIGKHVTELTEQNLFNPSATMRVIEERRRVTITQETSSGKTLVATSNPVFDSEGNLIRIVTTSRDMSDMASLNYRLGEAEKLIDAYQATISSLRGKTFASERMIVSGNKMETLMKTLENIASVSTNVLISGESGVGKSVAARHVHNLSNRKDKPFVVINCGSIPEDLIESELFGNVEDSYSGSTRGGKAGLIELADGGTIFLDEVGDLPLSIQAKLFQVINEHKLMRIGGKDYIDVDVRIISATNRNLEQMVKDGTFREDLYYRLSVVPIVVPPLRERKDEIEELAWKFLSYYNNKYNYNKEFSPDLLNFFRCYTWPGNIRELENIIERLVVTVDGDLITKNDLPAGVIMEEESDIYPLIVNKMMSLKDATSLMEQQLLSMAIQNSESTYKIAEILGVNQSTVVRKLKAYNLHTEKKKHD